MLIIRPFFTALICCVLVIAPCFAQEERVPSGDLSAFFNPPGVAKKTTDSTSFTTRKGSPKLKLDPAVTTADNTDPKASVDTKTPDSSPSVASARRSGAASGRVKLESKSDLEPIEGGVTFGSPRVVNWRVGVVMMARNTGVKNVEARIPVPVSWPEQNVSVHEEDMPPEFDKVGWEKVDNVQMLKINVKSVPAGERLIGTVTFRVETSQINAPANKSVFRIPTKRPRTVRKYLGESPEIEFDTKMKKFAKDLFAKGTSDWTKVELLFDWVRDNIEERAGDTKGSVATFKDNSGTGEDRVGVFVAMCRINKVPARMVFVDGSQYAEFYLVDDKEQGHWIPCAVSGIREFGEIGEPRVILQKGDNFKLAGEKLKFVPAKAAWEGSKSFVIRFAREPLSAK